MGRRIFPSRQPVSEFGHKKTIDALLNSLGSPIELNGEEP